MTPTSARKAVCFVLTLICVIQTSLIVIFTARHAQKQQEIHRRYREVTRRALSTHFRCMVESWNVTETASDVSHAQQVHVRETRQTVQGDQIIQHLITEQEAMLERHCSNETKLCLPGPKGDPGPLGQVGVRGQAGPAGGQGLTGVQGVAGDSGLKGLSGTQGNQGSKGVPGGQGQPGVKGDTGALGVKGDAGVKGATGNDGVKGQRGQKGDLGPGGARGDPGVKGASGQKGDPGSKGAAGPDGPAGAKGPSDGSGRNCSCVAAPTIQGSPQQQTDALPGSTLILHCPITASPTPDVTWSRDHGNLPRGAQVVGLDLIIPDVSNADSGKYTCTAKNLMGSVSVGIDVKVSELNCDFERNLCGWKQGTRDNEDWLLNRGQTPSFGTGPNADHTFANVSGQYVYMDSDNGNPGDVADLESPLLSLSQSMCLHFWYSMFGSDVHNLSLIAKDDSGAESVMWSMSGDQGQGWHEAKVTVTPAHTGGHTQLVFRASRHPTSQGDRGDIAVDDVQLTSGMCLQSPDTADCSFNVDTCKWAVSGDWPWTIHTGPSGKPNTGPQADHSGDVTQSYLYADGSSAPAAGSNGTVTSPFFDPSTPVCVDFYYHMYGVGEGSLSLAVKSQDGTEYKLWQRSGDQGQEWQHASLTLPQESLPYSIAFTATRGSLAYSDVALDDVTMTQGPCQKGGDLGCDFEQLNLCTWAQDKTHNDNFDWDVQVASNGGALGGPFVDETLQTDRGHYVLVPNTGHSPGEKAALLSRLLPRGTTYCLSLWSYIPTASSGSINIMRQMYSTRQGTLFAIQYHAPSNGQQVGWTHMSLTISGQPSDISVVLEAVVGDPSAPPMAVDDISLSPGVCH